MRLHQTPHLNNERLCVNKSNSSSTTGLLGSHRISLHKNKTGYYIHVKNEANHATRSLGPLEGPLTFSGALIWLGTQMKLEGY
jgi:hypothetical protein